MFFKDWIESEPETYDDNCNILKFKEISNAREEIYEKLIKTVINHYTNPKRVQNYLNDEKFSRLEKYINDRFPSVSNHEKGDFGEIFGTEHLKQLHNYTFPILKLRHKLKNNRSLEGEDILGFYIEDDNIIGICIGESKVRSGSGSGVIDDAINQLEKSYNPHPVLINFYSERVYEFNEELGEKIEDLKKQSVFNQIIKENYIFYITDFKPKKFKIRQHGLDNLTLINMYFEDLSEFIHSLFEDCRGYYHEK